MAFWRISVTCFEQQILIVALTLEEIYIVKQEPIGLSELAIIVEELWLARIQINIG